jgi:hypothetical protein
MCLGVESLSTVDIVAEAVYTPAPIVPPPVLPPPPPPPSSTFTPVETMSLSDARLGVRTALYRRLGSKFVARRDYHISCGRLSRIRFSCRAKWHHGGQWRATVEVFGTASDGEQFIDWKVRSIKRPTRRPTLSSAPPPPPPPPASSCNPAYPTVCIPDVPFDLDCPDVSARNFSVPGSDPDGFDGDADGIGCES